MASTVREARRLGIETVHQDRAVVGGMSVAREAERLVSDLNLNISSVEQEVRFCSGGESLPLRDPQPP
jgi:hypothetical protein